MPFQVEDRVVECAHDGVPRLAAWQVLDERPAVLKDLDSPLGLVRIDVSHVPIRVLPNLLGVRQVPSRGVNGRPRLRKGGGGLLVLL